jgi:hypothetical protein
MTTYTNLSVLRKNMCKNIISWALFGLLCISWSGLIFTHYHFNMYINKEDPEELDIWYKYVPLFVSNYVTMFFFLVTWMPIVCFVNLSSILCFIPSFFSSLELLCYSIYLQTVNMDDIDHGEYPKIVLVAGVFQFIIISIFTVLVCRNDGSLPRFCIPSVYTSIE